jgi:nucleoside-diphosphate-sugar epimerase
MKAVTEIAAARPRIAVTGAAGFTGGALVDRLLETGCSVRALVRNGQKPGRLGRRGLPDTLEIVHGDLADARALRTLVEGADVVIHVAAMFRTEGPRDVFFEVNQRGTERMLATARAAGARRFVYCSTIGVHGDVDETPADERSRFNPRDPYQESKLKAEEACRQAMREGGMEVVILRPCSIYGPGDLRMLKLFRMLARRRFLMVDAGEPNFHPVYIDDLVDAFIAASTVADAAGETFIVGGPRYLPLKEYVALAAAAVDVPPPRWRVPFGVMNVAAKACESACALLRVEPPLHRRRLRFFKHNRAFSIDKARKVLGYAPRVDVEEGFRRTVEWYRSSCLI